MKSSDRITILARQQQQIFHSGDLARLWNVHNKNTLHTMLKRYAKKGYLFRIYKGLYSLQPIKELSPLLLGIKALHSYAYVSTETILTQEGLMMQLNYSYTLVSSYSRHFKVGPYQFRSRKLNDRYLHNPAGIIEENGILKATTSRALADLFYFNPKAHLDGMKTVNLKELNAIQKEIGYPLTKNDHAHTA